ncbi:LodA/GoxA family CTQ-dependent oxidase [Streptomyces actinomycinicus]|uniref:LodA/GoxA family CTQ-dependent oxidase n=1 Tax=Streptomyces actinomycinicus TaxID=1695166 RepID=UPI0027DA9FC7|nr:LodA/GoxA family CTQ-dependent oxidase [Streptomyces actinomycinicus]
MHGRPVVTRLASVRPASARPSRIRRPAGGPGFSHRSSTRSRPSAPPPCSPARWQPRRRAATAIYGYTADGRVVRELTTADPEVRIEWAVHVANRKAAWYQFRLALDIPAMAGKSVARRNKGVDRRKLVIDPGRKVLDAASTATVDFSGGRFLDALDVPLGSMHTDAQGRLVVLGGRGHSAAPFNAPLASFGNNDGWCDDTSDGPVTATLTLAGHAATANRPHAATPAAPAGPPTRSCLDGSWRRVTRP